MIDGPHGRLLPDINVVGLFSADIKPPIAFGQHPNQFAKYFERI
jgi:hypothetical protein